MADEYSRPPHNRKMPIPAAYNWETLTNKSGDALEVHYNHLLRELAKKKGISAIEIKLLMCYPTPQCFGQL